MIYRKLCHHVNNTKLELAVILPWLPGGSRPKDCIAPLNLPNYSSKLVPQVLTSQLFMDLRICLHCSKPEAHILWQNHQLQAKNKLLFLHVMFSIQMSLHNLMIWQRSSKGKENCYSFLLARMRRPFQLEHTY